MVPGQPGPSQRAAAYQAQQKQQSASQSIIMPIYTFGIVAFFVFTIVKMLMKKTGKLEAPTKPIPVEPDPKFTERVFGRKNSKEKVEKKLGEFEILHSIFLRT
jgi:large-conductance mechanosensitive channel